MSSHVMTRLCTLMICVCGAAAFGLDLVRDGHAVGEFVLPKGAPFTEVYATRDIRHWIEKMTGARAPIVSKASDVKGAKVYVGKTFAGKFRADLKALAGTQGYAIRREGDHVYVFGDRPLGTLFGLFALLENNSDIIWARPNPRFGTIHGHHESLTLTRTDELRIPAVWWRCMGTTGWPASRYGPIWNLRNGLNTVGRGLCNGTEWDTDVSLGNNLFRPIKNAHGMAHPEWYGYKPETRSRDCGAGEGSLCMSQPGLPEIWTKAVAEEIKQREKLCGRRIPVYTIGPGDNWFCCQCEECLKPIKLPDGTRLECKHPSAQKDPLFRSTQFQIFINEVMEHWKALCPHTRLVSLAYIHLAEPPAVDLHPDFRMYFAPYPTSSMHFPLLDPRQPKPWRERFEKWLKKAGTVGFYEYFYSKPVPQAFYLAENLKAVTDSGGNLSELFFNTEVQPDRQGHASLGNGAKGWDIGGMNAWVIARLLWDPTQDVDDLYKYYLRRTYREGAPEMIEYYEMIRDIWLDPGDRTVDSCHASQAGVYAATIVKRGLERKCFRLLESAEKAVGNPHSKTMIRRKIDVFKGYSKAMQRLKVAEVEEMSHDGDTFESVQWQKPEPVDDFRILRWVGDIVTPDDATSIKAAHDGKDLYLRFAAADRDMSRSVLARPAAAAGAHASTELWPKGDHIEFWLELGRDRYVFAFNRNGSIHDAKNLDRDWNSGWAVKTRKTAEGWEVIAVIPMEALKIVPGDKRKWLWTCAREIAREGDKPVKITYGGHPLFRTNFPVVMGGE